MLDCCDSLPSDRMAPLCSTLGSLSGCSICVLLTIFFNNGYVLLALGENGLSGEGDCPISAVHTFLYSGFLLPSPHPLIHEFLEQILCGYDEPLRLSNLGPVLLKLLPVLYCEPGQCTHSLQSLWSILYCEPGHHLDSRQPVKSCLLIE